MLRRLVLQHQWATDRLGRVQTQLRIRRAGLGMGRRLFCQCSLLTPVKLSLSVTCGVSK